MNVVLYMRYSSSNQTEQSIEGQERVCTEYCNQNGYTIIHKYVDRAKSATTTAGRDEFNQMIKDAEAGGFEAVVVYKLDRFSRNRYDSAFNKAKLNKSGVKLLSATEHLTDTPESILLESVLVGLAEFYSVELSQKVKRGLNETAHKCRYTGGNIPYGYDIAPDNTFAVNEKEAHYVRSMFDMYANQNMNFCQIARSINSQGCLTKKGNLFHGDSIQKILKSPRYIGVYEYDGLSIPEGMPHIVDDVLFNRVQTKMKNAMRNITHKAEKQLLTGFLYYNGTPMHSTTYSKTKNRSGYYRDVTKKILFKINDINTIVCKNLYEFLNSENIEKIVNIIYNAYHEEVENNSEHKILQQQLKELNKCIDNLIINLCHSSSESLAKKLKEMEEHKAEIENKLSVPIESTIFDKEHILFFFDKTKENLMNGIVSPSFLNTFLDRVDISPEGNDYRIDIKFRILDSYVPINDCVCPHSVIGTRLQSDKNGVYVILTIPYKKYIK